MIKILADSCCNFSAELKNNPQIVRIPLTLQLGDEVFSDSSELDINNFIDYVKHSSKPRHTAAPSPQLYVDECSCDEPVFIVTLSSGISGSYNSAVAAAKICQEEFGKNNIFVIDSHSAATGQTLLCEELFRMDKNGMTPEAMAEKILEYRDSLRTYFILKNYSFFVDSGRLNPYVAKLCKTLNIVPICGAVDGHAALITQARGDKGALKKLISIIKKTGIDTTKRKLSMTHIDCPEKAEEIRSQLCSELNFADSEITEATGLCVIYADIDGIIITI